MPEQVHLVLGVLVFVLVGLGVLVRDRREARRVEILGTASPPPDDPTVAARFKSRRLGCIVVCAVLCPVFLGLLFTRKEPLVIAGMVALGALFVVPMLAMRCPACGEIPSPRGDPSRGIALNPRRCPSCGVRLR